MWQTMAATTRFDDAQIPFKIHQVWLGPRPIPVFCQEMMETWKLHHPSWEYLLWTDASLESAQLPPRLAEAFRKADNSAEKSDILRLWLVLQHGGLYVDVDFECLRPFDDLHHRFSFFAGASNVGAFELNNGLFAASPAHPVVQFLMEHVTAPWPEWGGDDVDPGQKIAYQLERSGMLQGPLAPPGHAPFLATTGPGFFTRGVMQSLRRVRDSASGLAPVAICPAEIFYPVPNSLRNLPAAQRTQHATQNSMAIHHWCRTWALEQDCVENDELVERELPDDQHGIGGLGE